MDTRITIGGADFYCDEIITPNQFADRLYGWLVSGRSVAPGFKPVGGPYLYHYIVTRSDDYEIEVRRNIGSDDQVFIGAVGSFVNGHKLFCRGETYILTFAGSLVNVFQAVSQVKRAIADHGNGLISKDELNIVLDRFLAAYLAIQDEANHHNGCVDDERLGGRSVSLLIDVLSTIKNRKPPLGMITEMATQILTVEG